MAPYFSDDDYFLPGFRVGGNTSYPLHFVGQHRLVPKHRGLVTEQAGKTKNGLTIARPNFLHDNELIGIALDGLVVVRREVVIFRNSSPMDNLYGIGDS